MSILKHLLGFTKSIMEYPFQNTLVKLECITEYLLQKSKKSKVLYYGVGVP